MGRRRAIVRVEEITQSWVTCPRITMDPGIIASAFTGVDTMWSVSSPWITVPAAVAATDEAMNPAAILPAPRLSRT